MWFTSFVSDLKIVEPLEVDVEVGPDAVHGPRQSDSSNEQHEKDHIGHRSRDVHHLNTWEKRRVIYHIVNKQIQNVVNLSSLCNQRAAIHVVLLQASNLSWGLDTFPQAEVEDEDHHDETQGQLPARQAQVLDTSALMEVQHTSSADTNTDTQWTCVNSKERWITKHNDWKCLHPYRLMVWGEWKHHHQNTKWGNVFWIYERCCFLPVQLQSLVENPK